MLKKFTKNRCRLLRSAAAAIALTLCAAVLCACSFDFEIHNNDSGTSSSSAVVSASGESDLVVHYLDVGQGDCIFAELPDSSCMLIDAGVSGLGEGIVSAVEGFGYSKIDYLVATHPHADHIGSMAYVVENMDIGQIYMPKASTTTKTYEKLLEAISDKGLTVKSAKAGTNILNESDIGFTVDVLGPVTIDEDELNNCSIILKMTYGESDFLFLGDAEKDELESVTADMSAEVLKVGHHGSNTSTTEDLLERVNPTYAVISCGKDNSYGHPHQSTLELLQQFNVNVYRTDEDKTVVISTDGSEITVKTGEASVSQS